MLKVGTKKGSTEEKVERLNDVKRRGKGGRCRKKWGKKEDVERRGKEAVKGRGKKEEAKVR